MGEGGGGGNQGGRAAVGLWWDCGGGGRGVSQVGTLVAWHQKGLQVEATPLSGRGDHLF